MTKSGTVDPKGRKGSWENRKDQLSMVFSILCNFWQAASKLFLQHEEKNDAGSHEYFLLKEESFQKIMILVKQSHSLCFYIVSFFSGHFNVFYIQPDI